MLMGVASDAPAATSPIIIFKGLFHFLIIILQLQIQQALRLSYAAPSSSENNDSKALMNFKSTLSPAKAFDTWNIEKNPCSGTWKGVLCNEGVVWGLQLENMDLTGKINVDALVPLSNNRFSGQIKDDAFTHMTSLKKVHLANNRFNGSIPSSLARPRLLELRLENNGFTGTIPEIRKDLNVLNLSNNQLRGPIPQNLNNVNPSAFAGNKDLCGKPLKSPCPIVPPPLAAAPTATDNDDADDQSNPTKPQTAPSPVDQLQTPPPSQEESSDSVNNVVIVIVGTVCAAAVLVLAIIYRRNKKEVPQLGKTVSSLPPPSPAGALPMRKQQDMYGHQGGEVERGAAKSSLPETVPKKGEPASKLSFVREDRPQFDLTDLLRASAEVLGSGNLGSSYKAVLLDDQILVVKRFNQMHNVQKEDFHENMRRLARLEHPNLLPLVAYYYRKDEKLLVYDYMLNGNLASRLHGKHTAEHPALDWPKRLKIIKGVAKGLDYLHRELPASLNAPHGHLKSSNVVINDCYQPLLMDYGLIPVVNEKEVKNLFVAYKSPDYIKGRNVTRKTDVWNLGILILETLTGKSPTVYLARDESEDYYSESSSPPAWAEFVGGEDFNINNTTDAMSVFDAEMGNRNGDSEVEMIKLLKIGMACCQEDEDKRLDIKEALDQIESIQERSLL